MTEQPTTQGIAWDDARWEMIMECPDHEIPEHGFTTPSAELVAKYCKLYPQHAEDFIDFAATCESQERLMKLFPPRESTEAELDRGVKAAMRIFRKVMRKARGNKT